MAGTKYKDTTAANGVLANIYLNPSLLEEDGRYFLMKNREAWRAGAHGVTESRTQRGNQTTTSKPNQTGSKRKNGTSSPFHTS